MSALTRVVRAGVVRRKVSTLVVALATAAAVTSGVLGAGLLVASSSPFDRLFDRQNGAHLVVSVDPAVSTAELGRSVDVAGVSEMAGPFPSARITVTDGPPLSLSVVGRDQPDATVDAVTLTEGRWAAAANEIVISAGGQFLAPLGTKLATSGEGAEQTVSKGESPPQEWTFTVVGHARSASESADAWMTVEGLSTLEAPAGWQLLYRLDDPSQVSAAQKAVTDALPDGALGGAQSWLTTRAEAVSRTAVFVPFLLGFGGLSLALAVLVVGTVIAGTVGSGTRRIGVLKAVGFTPAQLVRAHALQALIPALVGTGLGLVAGNLLALPMLRNSERLTGDGVRTIAPWVNLAVAAGILAVVGVVALVASGRAGRLRTVDALAVGRAPADGRGRAVARLLARMPVPRPVGLGVARPFAAPGRALTLVAAVAVGCAAVTLALGLALSLNRIQAAADHTDADVSVEPAFEGMAEPQPLDRTAVEAAIRATPGTGRWFGLAETETSVAGLSGSVRLVSVTAQPGWAGYELVSGRWFGGRDEAVAPPELLRALGLAVGDTVRAGTRDLRIVGEVFDPSDSGRRLLTLAGPTDVPHLWQIELGPGSSEQDYLTTLNRSLEPLGGRALPAAAETDELVIVVDTLASLLTVLMIAVAGLGVLNTVTLDVRDRVHDIGVQKALGLTPGQTLVAVLSSVMPIGVAGALIGVPAGFALQRVLVPAMAEGAGTSLPPVVLDVYQPVLLIAVALGGPLLAGISALPAASWAARVRTATALRTE